MWFKVDDTFHSHPKVRAAGLEAVGLWTVAGAYSMSYKTDSFVPDWFVESWPGGAESAEKLVRAELWKRGKHAGQSGFVFHDWDDYQPLSDEIERERRRARERQQEYRRRRRENAESHG